jgi:hypothetical protein
MTNLVGQLGWLAHRRLVLVVTHFGTSFGRKLSQLLQSFAGLLIRTVLLSFVLSIPVRKRLLIVFVLAGRPREPLRSPSAAAAEAAAAVAL